GKRWSGWTGRCGPRASSPDTLTAVARWCRRIGDGPRLTSWSWPARAYRHLFGTRTPGWVAFDGGAVAYVLFALKPCLPGRGPAPARLSGRGHQGPGGLRICDSCGAEPKDDVNEEMLPALEI